MASNWYKHLTKVSWEPEKVSNKQIRHDMKALSDRNWKYDLDYSVGSATLVNIIGRQEITIWQPYDLQKDDMGFFEESGEEKPIERWQVQCGDADGQINEFEYANTYPEALNLVKQFKNKYRNGI